MSESTTSAVPVPVRRPVRAWDVVLTIVLLVLLALVAAFASAIAPWFGMAGDFCRVCDGDLMTTGMLVSLLSPWVAWLAAVVVGIVLMVRRRLAFWAPLAGFGLLLASWFLGFGLLGLGAG